MIRSIAIITLATLFSACQKEKYQIIIKGANIVDGTGSPAYVADVGINADTIAFVGDLSKAEGEKVIDAKGQVLSPGFIDTHSHHDRGMFENREMEALTSQGVTTMIIGQDGGSQFPLKDLFSKLERTPIALNVGSYTGHNRIRRDVLGEQYDRIATPEEVEKMKSLLKEDLENGSLGLSTGLEYDPGIYSDPSEVVELAKILSPYQARYISHIRSEDRNFWSALNEIIAIGGQTGVPVQLSHAKLAMKSLWGQADKMIAKMDSARNAGIQFTADIYPYTYWQSTMQVLFPERNFNDLKAAQFALTELTTPEGVIIGNFSLQPEYVSKTLAEVAVMRNKSPEQTLMDLINWVEKENGEESIIATSMDESDIEKIMSWPYSNICSDGSISGLHPRGHGSFPKIIRYYVRERNALSLEEAVHKMTMQAAENLNLKKRGQLKPGFYADLVLFDPATIADHATYEEPHAKSTGISLVIVNGTEVLIDGKAVPNYPGQVLRRAK